MNRNETWLSPVNCEELTKKANAKELSLCLCRAKFEINPTPVLLTPANKPYFQAILYAYDGHDTFCISYLLGEFEILEKDSTFSTINNKETLNALLKEKPDIKEYTALNSKNNKNVTKWVEFLKNLNKNRKINGLTYDDAYVKFLYQQMQDEVNRIESDAIRAKNELDQFAKKHGIKR